MSNALTRRRPEPTDAAALAALRNTCEEVDRLGEHHDADDCAEEFTDPRLDLDGSLLVLDGDALVAAQMLYRLGERLHAAGEVHPDHRGRGIGSELLGVARERAAVLGARLEVRVPEAKQDAVALAEGEGLTPIRWWSELRRDLSEPVAPVAPPDGITIHPLGPDYDPRWDEPLRTAHNAAFADHFGFVAVSVDDWVHRTRSRHFRPTCSAAATTADGAVVGYLMAEEYEADTAATGVRELYVGTVGTVREWRGRRIAGALLAHVLAAAAREGYGRSTLTVDAENPTGALGLYARAGYVLLRRDVTYRG